MLLLAAPLAHEFMNDAQMSVVCVIPEKWNKSPPRGICWKTHDGIPVEASQMEASGPGRIFHFHLLHLRWDFTPFTPTIPQAPHLPTYLSAPLDHKYLNLLIYIHYKTHTQCNLWLWGHSSFIYSSYLFILLAGETLVSVHLCWLLAITEHLEPPSSQPEGRGSLRGAALLGFRNQIDATFYFDFSQELHEIQTHPLYFVFITKEFSHTHQVLNRLLL